MKTQTTHFKIILGSPIQKYGDIKCTLSLTGRRVWNKDIKFLHETAPNFGKKSNGLKYGFS